VTGHRLRSFEAFFDNRLKLCALVAAFLLSACAHSAPTPPTAPVEPTAPTPTAAVTKAKPRVVVHLGGSDSEATSVETRVPQVPQTAISEACERVDINIAVAEDLITLPGIGPSKAAAIVSYRDHHGKFIAVDHLTEVPGIGTVTLEKLRPFLVAGDSVAAPAPPSQNSDSAEAEEATPRVNINIDSPDELTALRGVGPTTAARIIAYREMHGPFMTKEALTEVKGIGPKTLEKLRSHFEVVVDINEASAEDFAALGFKNGSKIVQRRAKRGNFKDPSKLKKVPGTDKKLLKRLRSILQ